MAPRLATELGPAHNTHTRSRRRTMGTAVPGRRAGGSRTAAFLLLLRHLTFILWLRGAPGGGIVGLAFEHRTSSRRSNWVNDAAARGEPAAVAARDGFRLASRRSRTTQQRAAVEGEIVAAATTVGGNTYDDPAASRTMLPLIFEESPRSAFGTKEYWDDMYQGRGDFSSEQYSWYCHWDGTLQKHVKPYLKSTKNDRMLLPGIGNDPLLLDLLTAGYSNLVAQDYSTHALDRQRDLLSHYYAVDDLDDRVQLVAGDVRALPPEWRHTFDVVLEKGLLDAVYLSGDGHVERAVASLGTALRPGGIFVSVSGVVPELLRRQVFLTIEWRWLRDGSHDLQAGCFIFQRR